MKVGSRGEHVKALQHSLNQTGVSKQLMPDGIFGPRTEAAVRIVQAHLNMQVTGEVDHGFSAALRVWDIIPPRLTGADLHAVAHSLEVDYPAVAAIVAVESRGNGFLASGRPTILFERHIMRRRLRHRGIAVEGRDPAVVNSRPGGYLGGEREWVRFSLAAEIHRAAAIESCSWGLFQVMGFHWERLQYGSAEHWMELMSRSEQDHLEAFRRFVHADPVLLRAIREHRWDSVARRYNGPSYAINKYDERLRVEFEAARTYT